MIMIYDGRSICSTDPPMARQAYSMGHNKVYVKIVNREAARKI